MMARGSSAAGRRSRRTERGAKRSINESLTEYGRGIAGGLLFSLPLLFTEEMWHAGLTWHPLRVLLFVLVTFGLLLGYNRYSGLRTDSSWAEIGIDSVEEMGLGLLISGVALLTIGRITSASSLGEIIGLVALEAMTVAIGVSVGTAQLGEKSDDTGTENDSEGGKASQAGPDEPHSNASGDEEVHFGGQVVLALCGAILISANVAPTLEIVTIASSMSVTGLFVLSVMSLVLGGLILHHSQFVGASRFVHAERSVDVLVGSVVTYAAALVASAVLLWFFGRFDGQLAYMIIAQTVVLGVAGVLGASAGRLLLQ
ncbi:MAG: DUF2391 family protein [Gemmatimonadaceae bacterium]